MRDVAVLLTTYNRPTLVADTIASVLQQDCHRWRLYILDDGCNTTSREAIHTALRRPAWRYKCEIVDRTVVLDPDERFIWWRGPQRTMTERKASISYSWTINIALNYLLRDERYVVYVCDDDFLYPESIRARADFLDAHAEIHVCYGRTRSIQYGADGTFNTWGESTHPQAGMAFPRPTGPRVQVGSGGKRCYLESGERDPQTGLTYIEEGYWEPGLMRYGIDGQCDHTQLMHRVDCLNHCRQWAQKSDGTFEYWGEELRHGVGDAAFFSQLAEVHEFYGVNVWVTNKRFHNRSDGVCDADVRE